MLGSLLASLLAFILAAFAAFTASNAAFRGASAARATFFGSSAGVAPLLAAFRANLAACSLTSGGFMLGRFPAQ